MCGRWKRKDARLTLQSVVTQRMRGGSAVSQNKKKKEKIRPPPRLLKESRKWGESVKKHLEIFTETGRERERKRQTDRERERRREDVSLDAALSQTHCYRQSRYKYTE